MTDDQIKLLAKLAKDAIALLPPEEQVRLHEEQRQSFAQSNVALSRPEDAPIRDKELRAFAVQSVKLQIALQAGGDTVRKAVQLYASTMDDQTWASIETRIDAIKAMFHGRNVTIDDLTRFSHSDVMHNVDNPGELYTSKDGAFILYAEAADLFHSLWETSVYFQAESDTMLDISMKHRNEANHYRDQVREIRDELVRLRSGLQDRADAVRNAAFQVWPDAQDVPSDPVEIILQLGKDLKAEADRVKTLNDAAYSAWSGLGELNTSNYTHDDVDELNTQSVNSMDILSKALEKVRNSY